MSHPFNINPNISHLTPVARIPDQQYNPLIDTDSYKPSHYLQYPADTEYMQAYFEARGGDFAESTLFGLQYILHKCLSVPFTEQQVLEAEAFWTAHGEPFNKDGFLGIVKDYGGHWPVTIRALPEGTVVPIQNALFTVECFDPKYFWCVGYIESFLERLWYPGTIAISSRASKKILKQYLDKSSDTPEADLPFKLHDFGARGVSSYETAQLGGAAHLLNFMGTDTAVAIKLLQHYYGATEMPAFSIPASEHSTVCSWGRDKELDFYRNFVKVNLTDRQLPPGVPKLAACVSDTYNIYEAVRFWCSKEMREVLKASGGTLVIRPDSGDPVHVLEEVFTIMQEELGNEVTVNSKGYKVLPPYLRVIQGDGIDRLMMEQILINLVNVLGWSATNIAFGSGGGLLQKVNRDTQKFAYKACAIRRNGQTIEIYKDPITDPGKFSKRGRLDLVDWNDGQGIPNYQTIKLPDNLAHHPYTVMQTVYSNGKVFCNETLDVIRKRMSL